MTSHLMIGFTDELVKTAGKTSLFTKALRLAAKTEKGKTKAGKKVISRLAKTQSKTKHALKDPEYRKRIAAGATLGAGTGAATAVAGGGDDSVLKRALKGAGTGAVGGTITGAAFPGWFARSNRHL